MTRKNTNTENSHGLLQLFPVFPNLVRIYTRTEKGSKVISQCAPLCKSFDRGEGAKNVGNEFFFDDLDGEGTYSTSC